MLSPLNSQALYHLGDAQLAVYDNFLEENHCKDDNVNNYMLYLDDAKKSYRASIQLEGKPLNRNEHCLLINDSIWWKKRHRNLRKGSAIPQPKGETMPKSKQNENFKISTNKASPVVIRGKVLIKIVTVTNMITEIKITNVFLSYIPLYTFSHQNFFPLDYFVELSH